MTLSTRVQFLACALATFVAGACVRLAPAPSGPASLQPGPLSTARQLVLVITPDWDATTGTLRRFVRDDASAAWLPTGGVNAVVVGRTGIAWGNASLASSPTQPVKHEGDGRSPAGVFPLDTAFGFATGSELAWLRMPYAALQPGSDCVDDEASAYYNTVVDRSTVPRIDWNSAEHMREVAQYRMGVIVGYNASPPRRGRGSCIFLHIWGGPNSTTAGCTALDAGELEALMRWLDRARRPVLVQLTAREYARFLLAWQLPAV